MKICLTLLGLVLMMSQDAFAVCSLWAALLGACSLPYPDTATGDTADTAEPEKIPDGYVLLTVLKSVGSSKADDPQSSQPLSSKTKSQFSIETATMENDILISHTQFSAEYQPSPGSSAVADIFAYIACGSTRASPLQTKTLKNLGNQKGSLWINGYCKVANGPTEVHVMAYTSQNQQVYTTGDGYLYVEHYRRLRDMQPRETYHRLFNVFTAKPPSSNFDVNVSTCQYPDVCPVATKEITPYSNDWVYIVAAAPAYQPEITNSLFGFQIKIDTTTVSRSKEYFTENKMDRITQHGFVLFKTSKSPITVASDAYGSGANESTYTVFGSRTQLHGMIFRQNSDSDDGWLLQDPVSYIESSGDLCLAANTEEVNLIKPTKVHFATAGLLRVDAHANVEYLGDEQRTCFMSIGITKGLGEESSSMGSERSMKSPYLYHDFFSEALYEIPVEGDYYVRTFMYCEVDHDKHPANVIRDGTGTFIYKYQQP